MDTDGGSLAAVHVWKACEDQVVALSTRATVGRARLSAIHEKVDNGADDMEKPKSSLPNPSEVHQIVVRYVVTASESLKRGAEPGNLVGKREPKDNKHNVDEDAREDVKVPNAFGICVSPWLQ